MTSQQRRETRAECHLRLRNRRETTRIGQYTWLPKSMMSRVLIDLATLSTGPSLEDAAPAH
jgi:hypothetical protein